LYRRLRDVIQLAVIVAESTRHRRFVGRLDPGADLLAQLTDVCRTHDVRAGELRATGTVEDATVGDRRLAGPAEILSFAAVVKGGVQAAVSLAHGGAVVGGKLVAARVVACDFVLDAYDDLPVEKAAPAPSFEAPARTTWSDVVAASAASDRKHEPAVRPAVNLPDRDEGESHSNDTIIVRPGDFIDHPKFGRCAVERVDGDMEFVTARLRNQRLIRLSLDVLTLIPAGQADGKNLFRAVAGK
jgi:predicted DNA-binding protein with PD1-like motif